MDQGLVQAVFKDIPEHSDETFIYPVKIEEGALTVRGATEEGVTAPVEDKADDVTGDAIAAVAPAGVKYYINDSQVEITDKNAVHLLTDEVLDDQVLIDHISNEIIGSDTGIPNGDYLYEFQYLDLVDSKQRQRLCDPGRRPDDRSLLAGARRRRHLCALLHRPL